MKPSKPLPLAAVVVATALVSWAVVRSAYGALPLLPWTAAPTLALLGLGEAYTALHIRARVRRRPRTRPIEPLVVARLAALAKASSLASAVLTGVFAGFAVHLVRMLDKRGPQWDFMVSAGTFLAGVGLIAGALFLEYACRVPKDPREERGEPGSRRR